MFVDTPLNFDACSVNYKKAQHYKIVIIPKTISFVSKCWGGRVSDKVLMQESGFLPLLEHGYVVLADRGFTVAEDVAVFGAKLEIPAFIHSKNQH